MDDNKHDDQFNASFQLPDDNQPKSTPPADSSNPAADLIRKKVEAAYIHEPDATQEAEEATEVKPAARSKHQEFIYNLTNSGRPLHEIQTAWHEYYAGLTDSEKHQVWQEFYNSHSQAAHHPAVSHHEPQPAPTPVHSALKRPAAKAKKITQKRQAPRQRTEHKPAVRKSAANQSLHSLLFGLATGSIVIIIFMFGFFNERIIAPFIQPSRTANNIPFIASNGNIGSDPVVIIPKINVEIPVVYDTAATNDNVIQQDLMNGVVHYAGTALPGQNGNLVIVGHSSNNILNPGKYKFAFVLLHQLQTGDTFYLQKDGKRYTYQIYKRQVVSPNDVSVLGATDKPATTSLITCDPPGTSNNRLVVTGEQIDPSPDSNIAAADQTAVASHATIIPGNSPSLWSRITNWFSS